MDGLGRALLERLLSVTDAEVPDEVLADVSVRVLDTLGAALSAAALGEGTAATRAFGTLASNNGSGASFWGTGGLRGHPADAAMANGMLSHAMDFDDTHTGSVMHPSGIVVPTALAVGEAVGAGGRATLAAAALGYEVAIRLGSAAPGAFQHRGFQGSAILGPFVAATVAARLLDVNLEVAANAWGIAGSMASGINEFHADGSEAKQLHLGWAAQSGIKAVLLAEAGATGPATVLEGASGVFSVFSGSQIDPLSVLRGAGEVFHVDEIATKPYPACHCIHAVVDAWFDMRQRFDLDPTDLDEIVALTCLVPEWYVGIVLEPAPIRYRPPTPYAARFSLPYCLASAVIDGRLDIESFRPENLADPERFRLASLVDYETADFAEFPEYFPGGLRLELRDGRRPEAYVLHNRGSGRAPLSHAEIANKLEVAADRSARPGAGKRLQSSIASLPMASDLNELGTAIAEFHGVQLESPSA